MKKVLNSIWQFLEAWGEHRYQMAKKHNFRYQ
jgi:hypothetical protein